MTLDVFDTQIKILTYLLYHSVKQVTSQSETWQNVIKQEKVTTTINDDVMLIPMT